MNKEVEQLNPIPPVGSVFFSQAHGLRWMSSGEVRPDIFYREVLSHSLFFRTLIISDSHAIQNWLLMELLPGGKFSTMYPGIERLITSGAIRIARRKDAGLIEIASGQVRRNVPVLVDGQLKGISEDFVHHSEKLARISETNELVYDPSKIHIGTILLDEVLDRRSLSRAYGINQRLSDEIKKVVENIGDGTGRILAAELFNYPELDKGFLAKPTNKQKVQLLATSIHSIGLPLTFGLTPTISPYSDDFRGSLAFYERRMPTIGSNIGKEDPLRQGVLEPLKLIPKSGEIDFIEKGIESILDLRETKEFSNLQSSRHKLLQAYGKVDGGSSEILRMEKEFDLSLVSYLAVIADKYDVSSEITEFTSSSLKRLAFETDASLEDLKLDFNMAATLGSGIGFLTSALTGIGIEIMSVFLATGLIFSANYLEKRTIANRLKKNRRDFNRASTLINLAQNK